MLSTGTMRSTSAVKLARKCSCRTQAIIATTCIPEVLLHGRSNGREDRHRGSSTDPNGTERPQRRGPLSAAIPLVRRLLRIQLTHVSFGVSETWLEVVNLQLRELVVGFGS